MANSKSVLIKMINYHEACDSALSVERGAGASAPFFGSEVAMEVARAAHDPAEETSIADASLVFTDRRVDVSFFARLSPAQNVNRIPYLDRTTLKVPLAQALQAYDESLLGAPTSDLFPWGHWATSIAPQTFFLPLQEPLLQRIVASKAGAPESDAYASFTPAQFYICKPNDGSQGNGIEIVAGLQGVLDLMTEVRGKDLGFDGSYVVQPYLPNPALYKGVKFDLRTYVVMVGDGCGRDASGAYVPAQAFMLRSGFARLCTTPYEGVTEENRKIATMHVANDGVNFKGEVKMSQILRTTEHVFATIADQAPETFVYERLWADMAALAGKVVTAFQARLRAQHEASPIPFASEAQHSQCYQLLGMDVMVDATGRLWLLECNAKPCMDWEREDVEHTVGPEVNTEVMAIALSLGLSAGRPTWGNVVSSERFVARTIPVPVRP